MRSSRRGARAAAVAATLALAPIVPMRSLTPQSAAAAAPATSPTATDGAGRGAAPSVRSKSQGKSKGATRERARAQLQSVREQIHRMREQASRESRERARLTAELRALELSLEKSGAELDRLNDQINDYQLRRAATAAAQTREDHALGAARVELAGELRSAYQLQRRATLEPWLTQHSPVVGRVLTYYHYLGQARAVHIAQLTAQVRQLGGLADELARQQAELAALQRSQEQTQQLLARQRDQRQQVLQQLGAAARTRTERLASLASEQADLERVLRGLSHPSPGHATAPAGAAGVPDTSTAFGRLRGQLPWPVNGQISAAFGQERASGVNWDGMVITARRDTPVRAVSAGRVVYADWLPGLGLLVILDHGDGYLSLYGHNDRLFKSVGTEVGAGDVIAAAGDTGGRAEPALYFEIRKAGKPIDPRPWFRTPQPAP